MEMLSAVIGSVLNLPLLDRYGWRVLEGLWVTLEIVAVTFTIGAALGLLIALMRLSRFALLRGVSFAYVYAFRGTPLLAQLFLVYYGAGQFRSALEAVGLWWMLRDAWYCVLITFTLNTAAYQAEILRGGILSLPKGQAEAAASLGLSRRIALFKIILPQALIVGLRPLGNELILMIKASAVASLVTVYDLMGAARLAFSRSYDFEVYLWAAALYLVLVETVRRLWARAEQRLTRHLRMG